MQKTIYQEFIHITIINTIVYYFMELKRKKTI